MALVIREQNIHIPDITGDFLHTVRFDVQLSEVGYRIFNIRASYTEDGDFFFFDESEICKAIEAK